MAQSARHGGHEVGRGDPPRRPRGRQEGRTWHTVASESRQAGHKVAVKARETTAQGDAKFGTVQKKDGHGEASNHTGMSNTAANGPKPYTRSPRAGGRHAPVTPPAR